MPCSLHLPVGGAASGTPHGQVLLCHEEYNSRETSIHRKPHFEQNTVLRELAMVDSQDENETGVGASSGAGVTMPTPMDQLTWGFNAAPEESVCAPLNM